jgi:tRNA splicing endonuclease
MAKRKGVVEEVILAEFAETLRQQREDQTHPSTDSILIFHKNDKCGTWKKKSGRITTACKARIEIEEILYLMERASIVCLNEQGTQISVKEMYAELVDSKVEGETVPVKNEEALRNYMAYGHLRRSGYKVSRCVDGNTWSVADSKQQRFGLKVVKPKDTLDCTISRHACVVDQSKLVFLNVTAFKSAPKPS